MANAKIKYDGEIRGKVSIRIQENRLYGSTTVNNKRYRWKFGLSANNAKEIELACDLADKAHNDILNGNFDITLSAYKFKPVQVVPSPQAQTNVVLINNPKLPSLNELWDDYAKIKYQDYSLNTLEDYQYYRKFLDKLSPKAQSFGHPTDLLVELRKLKYAEKTIDSFLRCLNSMINCYYRLGTLPNNPYFGLSSFINLKDPDQEIKCFTPKEIEYILKAFDSNQYNPKSSAYKHSYYYHYVAFCALTGCRPNEAVALTWDDFKQYPCGKLMVVISKAYQGRKDGKPVIGDTKTGETRTFRANKQLMKLIEDIPNRHRTLVFPSIQGGYLNHDNFARRTWTRVLEGLFFESVIDEFLSPYHLRHSFITAMANKGIELKAIAGVCGNSAEVIVKHYWKQNEKKHEEENTIFPELF